MTAAKVEQEDALGLEEQGSGMYHLDAEREQKAFSKYCDKEENNNSNNNSTTPQKSNDKKPIVD